MKVELGCVASFVLIDDKFNLFIISGYDKT